MGFIVCRGGHFEYVKPPFPLKTQYRWPSLEVRSLRSLRKCVGLCFLIVYYGLTGQSVLRRIREANQARNLSAANGRHPQGGARRCLQR